MSILDKHPAPWKFATIQRIEDANGREVLTAQGPISVGSFVGTFEENQATQRLILAAPVLLTALKDAYDDCPSTKDEATWKSERRTEALALIARIEGGK